jgi:hypothetical protein
MWQKRTKEELAEAQKRNRRSRIISVFVITLPTTAVMAAVIDPKGLHPHLAGLTGFGLRFIVIFVPMLISVSIVLSFKNRNRLPTMICPRCETSKYFDGVTACSCGATFQKLDEMKWIEDRPAQS